MIKAQNKRPNLPIRPMFLGSLNFIIHQNLYEYKYLITKNKIILQYLDKTHKGKPWKS
jgi:hypothetical protein